MKQITAFLFVLSAARLAAGQQDSPFVETRFHRIHLRNGNVIDGDLISKTEKDILLRLKVGEIAIRMDMVDRVEFIKMRSILEKPVPVETSKPASGALGNPRDPFTRPPSSRPPLTVEVFAASDETRQKIDALLVELGPANPENKMSILDNMVSVGMDTGPYVASLLGRIDRADISIATAVIVKCKDLRAVPILVKYLASPDPLIRTAAASALGGLGDTGITSDLLPLLSDKDLTVRTTAVTALSDLGGERAFDAILRLSGDPDRQIRSQAIQGSYVLATKLNLTDSLKDGWSRALSQAGPQARIDLLGALGRLKDGEVWRVVSYSLADTQPAVRATAASVLGLLASPESAQALASQASAETDAKVKIAIAQAAGAVGARGAIDSLIRWLRDDDQATRTEALATLKALTSQKFGPDPSAWEDWRAKNPGR
jgi:HEAT repeat protein